MRGRDTYILAYGDIDGEEQPVLVYFDYQPAEPDVGVSEGVEITRVLAQDKSIPALVLRKMVKEHPTYSIDVTNKTTESHDDWVNEILSSMYSQFEDERSNIRSRFTDDYDYG